jgi:hypothetical protein
MLPSSALSLPLLEQGPVRVEEERALRVQPPAVQSPFPCGAAASPSAERCAMLDVLEAVPPVASVAAALVVREEAAVVRPRAVHVQEGS